MMLNKMEKKEGKKKEGQRRGKKIMMNIRHHSSPMCCTPCSHHLATERRRRKLETCEKDRKRSRAPRHQTKKEYENECELMDECTLTTCNPAPETVSSPVIPPKGPVMPTVACPSNAVTRSFSEFTSSGVTTASPSKKSTEKVGIGEEVLGLVTFQRVCVAEDHAPVAPAVVTVGASSINAVALADVTSTPTD